MNLLRKLDTIPPPYSTILALVIPTILGIVVAVVNEGELRLLGVGIIVGAIIAIIMKKAAEVSDKAVLLSVLNLFRRRKEEN